MNNAFISFKLCCWSRVYVFWKKNMFLVIHYYYAQPYKCTSITGSLKIYFEKETKLSSKESSEIFCKTKKLFINDFFSTFLPFCRDLNDKFLPSRLRQITICLKSATGCSNFFFIWHRQVKWIQIYGWNLVKNITTIYLFHCLKQLYPFRALTTYTFEVVNEKMYDFAWSFRHSEFVCFLPRFWVPPFSNSYQYQFFYSLPFLFSLYFLRYRSDNFSKIIIIKSIEFI